VQGVPPEWRFLSAALSAAPLTSGPVVRDLQLTLANSSSRPLSVSPTPIYLIAVEPYGAGPDSEAEHLLPLTPDAFIVPAHGTLRLALPAETIAADIYKNLRGRRAIVTFGIAGLRSAGTTVRVAG
jgi:hypothetical protein